MDQVTVNLKAARQISFGSYEWAYAERDVILYALGLGCGWNEGRYVYENHEDFQVLPTFPVLALYHGALSGVNLAETVPNYSPVHSLSNSGMQR